MQKPKVRAVHCDYRSTGEEVYQALKKATDSMDTMWDRLDRAKTVAVKFNQDKRPERVVLFEGKRQQLVTDEMVYAVLRLLKERTSARIICADVSAYVRFDDNLTVDRTTTIASLLEERAGDPLEHDAHPRAGHPGDLDRPDRVAVEAGDRDTGRRRAGFGEVGQPGRLRARLFRWMAQRSGGTHPHHERPSIGGPRPEDRVRVFRQQAEPGRLDPAAPQRRGGGRPQPSNTPRRRERVVGTHGQDAGCTRRCSSSASIRAPAITDSPEMKNHSRSTITPASTP